MRLHLNPIGPVTFWARARNRVLKVHLLESFGRRRCKSCQMGPRISHSIFRHLREKLQPVVKQGQQFLGQSPEQGSAIAFLAAVGRPQKEATKVCKYSKISQKSRADIRLHLDPIGPVLFGPEPGIGFPSTFLGHFVLQCIFLLKNRSCHREMQIFKKSHA